jgi:hypothetical protein
MGTAKRLRRIAKGWPPQAAYPGNEGRRPYQPCKGCACSTSFVREVRGGHAQGTRYQGWFRLAASPTLRCVTLPLRGMGKDEDGYREAAAPHSEGLAAAGGLPWKRRPTTIPTLQGLCMFHVIRQGGAWRPCAGDAVPELVPPGGVTNPSLCDVTASRYGQGRSSSRVAGQLQSSSTQPRYGMGLWCGCAWRVDLSRRARID